MQAVIYTRVSSDQRDGRSVEEQESECRAVCERNGWPIAKVFCDNDKGASSYSGKDRPAWRDLKTHLSPGTILVTWECSRADRDLAAYVELRQLCIEREVLWSYSGKVHDLSSTDGKFNTGLDALLAEREAGNTHDRVMRAMRANAAAGKPHGQTPYGYRIIRDPNTGKSLGREPHPEESLIVRELVDRVLAGETVRAVCRDLDKRNVPRRQHGARKYMDRGWTVYAGNVTEMLQRPLYIGKRVTKGEVVSDGNWQPLMTEDEQKRLKRIFTAPERRTQRGVEAVWLLSGVATCSVCKETVRGKRQGTYSYYLCKSPEGCVGRQSAAVDAMATETLLRRLESPDALAAIQAEVAARRNVDVVKIRDDIAALEAELSEAVELMRARKLSPRLLAEVESSLQPQIDALQKQEEAATASVDGIEWFRVDIRSMWAGMSVGDRKRLLGRFLSVTIMPSRKGRGFDADSVKLDWR